MNRQLAKQYFDRAEASLEAGNPDEALALLNQLDAAFPNTKNIGVARARTYAAMGKIPEAVKLCDELVDRHQSRRASELKQQLILGVFEPAAVQRAATAGATPSRGKAIIALKWVLAMCLVASIAWSAKRLLGEFQAESETADLATAQSASIPQPPAAPKPGVNHPPFTWQRDDTGVPVWKSGIFRRVPCTTDPSRSINVYLPLAYDEKLDQTFPGVLISMPGGNPDFLELEAWAERQEVILIGLNTSRNGPSSNNADAQDAAFATITPSLRVNQEMGFAIGMSGGAMASWLVASRYPQNFRGVVMMGQGGHESYMLAPHIRVAYIRGEDEPNNWYIPRVITKLKANGNLVRDQIVPGAHVPGPVSVRVEMLNWMVHAARRDFGLPQPSR